MLTPSAARTRRFASTLLCLGCALAERPAFASPPLLPSASEGVTEAAADPALTGPVLERAALVSAILRRNASLAASRQGWQAAMARVRQAGVFDDPRVEAGVAPLSIGSSTARVGWEATVS